MNSDYLVGTVLENRYEILEMIGSGGMATVYKAKCNVLNRFVAIKVLKDSLKYDSEVVKRFNAESRAAACLSHPNIVQVYDVSEQGGLDYIVMEYVDGITLKDYIAKKGALPWEEACNFAVQIGNALECAHKNHIIHRDIKPHNVLLTRDGMLKVADFGIAQATTTDTLVAGSSNLGSVHYISPEQGRGGFTNERSDIYSLGVVLYEMLTGTLPFDGGNAVSIAIMKLEKDPIDCKIVNPEIPDNVAKITMKAISKEQHARYQTANEMVSDLENALKTTRRDFHTKKESDRFDTKRIESEEEYMPRRHNKKGKNLKNILLVAFLAIVSLELIGYATYYYFSGGRQEYPIPDLTGMTVEEAEAALSEANLMLDEDIEFEPSEEVEEGKIIMQKPGANQYVKKNRKIKITVSSGLEEGEIAIPLVEGLSFEDAVERLAKYNLKASRLDREDDSVPEGYVISQSPTSGTKVAENYSVALYVSLGKAKEEQTIVPKLTGYTKAQAEQIIADSGLSVGAVTEEANSATQGTVIAQNPSAKAEVAKGSKVDITVSKGQETPMKRKTLTITIPDSSPDTVQIKVVANGKVIHDKKHAKSEGTVDIEVQASKDASVQAYIDGNLVVDKTITF
ncbi:MAG: Stk1 family PASTA domain-containing Ser/Thr kinase [Clostridia bacterium]|nr:Stk1 family PASTA domain-containing Ser/Thr kinase [Clostridia bacterium]